MKYKECMFMAYISVHVSKGLWLHERNNYRSINSDGLKMSLLIFVLLISLQAMSPEHSA